MNSNFTLKDDEDLMSYDFGAQHFSNDEALKSLNETCGFSDVHIFIQPSILAYEVDPIRRVPINKDISRLEVEPHMITITAEPVTQQLLERERSRLEIEDDHCYEVETTSDPTPDINDNKKDFIQPKKSSSTGQFPSTPKSSVLAKRSLILPRPCQPLISVRLKSNEVIKVPKSILIRLRQEAVSLKHDNGVNGISIMKIPSETMTSAIKLPFDDHLSSALRRLSAQCSLGSKTPLKNPVNSYNKGANGKVTKTIRLRAALDKSTIAWSSTTRLKPKTSLKDQLAALESSFPSLNHESRAQNVPLQRKPASKNSNVPVVIKLRGATSKSKAMTLKSALQQISSDTLERGKSLLINGTTNGDAISSSSFQNNST